MKQMCARVPLEKKAPLFFWINYFEPAGMHPKRKVTLDAGTVTNRREARFVLVTL